MWGFSYACLSDIRHSRRPQYSAAGLFLCLQRRKADEEKVISGHKRAVILLDFEKVTSFEIQEETMKITYEFVNETIEIEVSDSWEQVIIELNRKEESVNKKETRRHVSLSPIGDEGAWLKSSEADPYAMIGEAIRIADEQKKKRELLEVIKALPPKQKALVEAIYFQGLTLTEYADMTGVSQPAISQQLKTVMKKIKKVLQKTL